MGMGVPVAIVGPASVSAAQPGADVLERDAPEVDNEADHPWLTLVWDDPINLMRYVTYVLQKVFGYSESKAESLMLKVHTEGKAVVSHGTREKMEGYVIQLQSYGLWSTLQRGDS